MLLLSETDEVGNTTIHEYDLAGHKIKTRFPSGLNDASNANKILTEEYVTIKMATLRGAKMRTTTSGTRSTIATTAR